MSIESEVFLRTHADFGKLQIYGFQIDGDVYLYSKNIMNDNFRVDIVIDKVGSVTGKIYDLQMQEEYISFRLKDNVGEFVGRVREEFKSILVDIRDKCFVKDYFMSAQANRITNLIQNTYHDAPEFLWSKFPGYGVFKNPDNHKWYAAILNVESSKIDKNSSGEVEIINVKLNEEKIPKLLMKKGFYPSYHMNKKNWVTIILDNTIGDEEILGYIQESHGYTESPAEWIVPANSKYFDIIDHLKNTDTVIWKQTNDVKIGDIVYLYVGVPYSAILYKLAAMEVNIPYEYKDQYITMRRAMKLKLLKRYGREEFPLERLKEYGVKAVRSARSMPEKLSKELNRS